MTSHRTFYLVGSKKDIAEWKLKHPGLQVVSLSLDNYTDALLGVRYHPWDETVYLPSYFKWTPQQRADVGHSLRMVKILGREV